MALDKDGKKVLPKGITWRENKQIYMIRFSYQGVAYTYYEKTLKDAKKTLADRRYQIEHGELGKADRASLNQAELSKIKNTFMAMLKEMKRDMRSEVKAKQAATKEIVAQMMAELTKGGDRPLTEITPEQMTDAILHTVDTSVFDPDKLAAFRSGIVSLFENLPRAAHEQ